MVSPRTDRRTSFLIIDISFQSKCCSIYQGFVVVIEFIIDRYRQNLIVFSYQELLKQKCLWSHHFPILSKYQIMAAMYIEIIDWDRITFVNIEFIKGNLSFSKVKGMNHKKMLYYSPKRKTF